MIYYWISVVSASLAGAIIYHIISMWLIRQPRGRHHYGSAADSPTLIMGAIVPDDDSTWPTQIMRAIADDPVPLDQFAAEQAQWYQRTHQLAIGASQAGG